MDEPIVLPPGEGEVVVESETRSSRIKAARDELLLSESEYAPDQRVARPHVHREHADAFYVLEGSLLFHLAGEQRRYRLELGKLRSRGVEPDRSFFERHDIFDV